MIQLVSEFKEYSDKISEFISKSNYKTAYFIELLSISKPTFYRKLKDKTFTITEIEKLTTALFPDEFLLKALRESEIDIKEGRTYTHDEAMKKLRRKHFN